MDFTHPPADDAHMSNRTLDMARKNAPQPTPISVPSLTSDPAYKEALSAWREITDELHELDGKIADLRREAVAIAQAERGQSDREGDRDGAGFLARLSDPRRAAAEAYLSGETPNYPPDDPRKLLADALAKREIVGEARRIRTQELEKARQAASAKIRAEVRPHWQQAVSRVYAATQALVTAIEEEQAIRRALDTRNVVRLPDDCGDPPPIDVYAERGTRVPETFTHWARRQGLTGDRS